MKLSIALHQPSKNGYNVKICINKDSKPAFISTSVDIDKKEQLKYGRIVSHPNAVFLNSKLSEFLNEYDRKISEINSSRLEYMSAKEIRSYLLVKNGSNATLSEYADELILSIHKQGRDKSASLYRLSMNYYNEDFRNLAISNITLKTLQALHENMKKRLSDTSCGIYFRSIRAIYNSAIRNEIVEISSENHAFRNFKMPQGKQGENKELSKEQLQLIFNTKYENKGEQFAVDVCKISFLLCGANFKDIFFAQIIKDGRINYVREKTKKTKQIANIISIKIEPELYELIDKYNGTSQIFDFGYKYTIYGDLLSYINKQLGKVSISCGLEFKLTTYHFRDSWATLAYNYARLRTEHIEYALGHSLKERKVTFSYIKIDLTELDEANRKIFDFVFNEV